MAAEPRPRCKHLPFVPATFLVCIPGFLSSPSPCRRSAKAKRFTHRRGGGPVVKGRKNTRKLLFVIVAISSPSFHPAPVFPLTHLLLSKLIDPKLKGTEKL